MSGGRESRLGACPKRAELVAWIEGELVDWDVGEHVLSCPACQTDRAAYEAGELDDEDRDDVSHDDDDDDDDDDEIAGTERVRPNPAPGTIWILRRPRGTHPSAPFTWVLVVDRDGDTAVTNLLLPAEQYRDGDTLIEHDELDLVAPAGIVERIPVEALAVDDGVVDAATVATVRDAVHVEAEEEEVAAARTWHALRFAAAVRPFKPPPDDDLGDDAGDAFELVQPLASWKTGAGTVMGGGTATTRAQTLVETLPVPFLAAAGWCEPELTIALERLSRAPTASGRVRVHRRAGAPATGPAIRITLLVDGAQWDAGGQVATLTPTSLHATLTLAATTPALHLSIELVPP